MLTKTDNSHFSESLFYADTLPLPVQKCYNGNIAAACITHADSTYVFGYTYDAQNRLTESVQRRDNQNKTSEWFNYDARGNITQLQRYNGERMIDDLELVYQPYGNQLINIEDRGDDADQYETVEYQDQHTATTTNTDMTYDTNGNLSQLLDCQREWVRFHDWDDENRLRVALDNTKAGYYGYDANGARVYKLTGTSTITHIGNDLSSAYVKLDTAILYPNPYVTITPKEYTKHYYANEERLATSIGQGGWCHLSPDAIDEPKTDHELYLLQEWKKIYDEKEYPFEYLQEDRPVLTENEDISGNDYDELQYTCPMRRLTNIQLEYTSDNLLWPVMHDNCDAQSAELDIFYRHSDHLGSASWITSYDSKPVQYLHYMPYGQLLANQMSYGYDEQYKFTGKERDAETGYDYFGARYYAPSLLHWITVDPLADKYPGISPYAYCSWNPIKYIDPDGRRPVYSTDGEFLGTDDSGLQGQALIMDSKLFKQNMSNESATSFDLGVDFLSDNAFEKYSNHYHGLSSRPDWDGVLTLSEANNWYRTGGGEPLFVDLGKIDLSGIFSLGEKYVGQKKSFNLLTTSNSIEAGLVYGNITLIRYPNHQVRAYSDTYNFEMHPWTNPLNWGRNIETIIGNKVAGTGIPYDIHFYGAQTLIPILPWIK